MSDSAIVPTFGARLDMLFRVWRTREGHERDHAAVAQSIRDVGAEASASDVSQWRSGAAFPGKAALYAIASVFPGDANLDYLTVDDRAIAIHAQLALVLELVEGRVKDVRLRSEHAPVDRDELTSLLQHMRYLRAEEQLPKP